MDDHMQSTYMWAYIDFILYQINIGAKIIILLLRLQSNVTVFKLLVLNVLLYLYLPFLNTIYLKYFTISRQIWAFKWLIYFTRGGSLEKQHQCACICTLINRWIGESLNNAGPTSSSNQCWTNIVSMLTHRLRRWPNIETTLVYLLAFAGLPGHTWRLDAVEGACHLWPGDLMVITPCPVTSPPPQSDQPENIITIQIVNLNHGYHWNNYQQRIWFRFTPIATKVQFGGLPVKPQLTGSSLALLFRS